MSVQEGIFVFLGGLLYVCVREQGKKLPTMCKMRDYGDEWRCQLREKEDSP